MNKLKSLLLTLAMVMGLAGLSFGQQVFISVDNHITATGQYCFGQTSCNVGATAATYWILTWTVTGTVSACTVATDSSADRVTWSAGGIVTTQTCTTTGSVQVGPLSTVNFVRNNVLTFTGSGSVSLTLKGYASNPSGGGGGGGVASVSASSPIASSGGVSPNISLTGLVPIANGGTGTATPGLIAGTNITSITGTWPNQTINAAGGGGGSGNMTAVGTPVLGSGGLWITPTSLAATFRSGLDCSQFSGADASVIAVACETADAALPNPSHVFDLSGLLGPITFSQQPWVAGTTRGVLKLPCSTITTNVVLAHPTFVAVKGCAEDAASGTTVVNKNGTLITTGSSFPTGSANTPLFCDGGDGTSTDANGCSTQSSPGNFQAPISDLTLDCANKTNCLPIVISNSQEGSSYIRVKARNFQGRGWSVSNPDGTVCTHCQNVYIEDYYVQEQGDYCQTSTVGLYINATGGNVVLNKGSTNYTSCATHAPTWIAQINGQAITMTSPHMEAASLAGTSAIQIGGLTATVGVTIIGGFITNMNGGDVFNISNAQANANIQIFGSNAGSSGATNLINDAISGYVAVLTTERNVGTYMLGKDGSAFVSSSLGFQVCKSATCTPIGGNVGAGVINQIPFYSTNGTAVIPNPVATLDASGNATFNNGTFNGFLKFAGFLNLLSPFVTSTLTPGTAGPPVDGSSNNQSAIAWSSTGIPLFGTTGGNYGAILFGPYTCPGGQAIIAFSNAGVQTCAAFSTATGTVTSVGTTAPLGGGPITTTGSVTCTTCVTASSPGAGIAHFAGSTQAVTSSAVVGGDLSANQQNRTCTIVIGADNGVALVSGDLNQKHQCFFASASTILEIDIEGNTAAGSSPTNLLVNKYHTSGAVTTALLSSNIAVTATTGAITCQRAAGGTGIDGTTTCGGNVSTTAVAAGDWIDLSAGAADATTTRATVVINYTIPN